jgi:hypothetical protein
MDEKPLWRKGFDTAERAVGPRLESLVRSDGFALAFGAAQGLQRTMQRRAERASRRVLHFWNLPAGSDVTRVLGELGQLQRQVRELSKQVEHLDRGETARARRA